MNEQPTRRKALYIVVSALVVLGIASGIGVATALKVDAAETFDRCQSASADVKAAIESRDEALRTAAVSLAASADPAIQTAVPGAGSYNASENAGRLTNALTKRRDAVLNTDKALHVRCRDRQQATALAEAARETEMAASAIVPAARSLDTDVAAFKENEIARIAAESSKASAVHAAKRPASPHTDTNSKQTSGDRIKPPTQATPRQQPAPKQRASTQRPQPTAPKPAPKAAPQPAPQFPRGAVVKSGGPCAKNYGSGGSGSANWSSNLVIPSDAINIRQTGHQGQLGTASQNWSVSFDCDLGF